jgi:cation:H+ antiporter
MIVFIILFFIGLFIVIKSANFLVDGASKIAFLLGVSPFFIGLTIVAFGTSSPELVVSIISALKGSTSLAFGNIIGSNIFNIAVILALSAIISPLPIYSNTLWKEIPLSFVGALVVFILGLNKIVDKHNFDQLLSIEKNQIGEITLSKGLILLIFFIIFLYYTFGIAKNKTKELDLDDNIKNLSIKKSIFYLFIGLAGLIIGSRLLVQNAVNLAVALKISEKIIGLTLVAIGTSIPEVATSLVAAFKRNSDIAVGNIIGSNIFNTFFILGTTALLKPIPIFTKDLIDLGVMVFVTFFLFLSYFLFHRKYLDRWEGIVLIITYIFYFIFLFVKK